MNILETFFQTALLEPLEVLGHDLLALLPNLLAMALILIMSITLAWICAQVVERLLRMIRIDALCQRIGITSALARGGVKVDPSFLTGRIMYWILLGLGVIAALAVLHLEPVNKFTESLLAYIPHFLTALLIVIAGFLLSNFISQAVLIAAVNAGLPPARLLAAFTRWGIQLVAIAMALEQLGIAETIVVVGFGIAFGGIVLAAALAFGLGARDLAKDLLEKRLSDRVRKESQDDLHHL
ncbi:MAG: hypothetical protein GKS05_11000 [Nitrospirales bacterium]|nr:hypothetical protein [Nitrospirales bacterium]